MAKDSPRPFIGINTDFFAATKTYSAHARVNAGYFDAVLAAGGMPILLPPVGKEPEIDALLDKLDGIVLTGGLDMDPRKNGQAMSNSIQPMADRRGARARHLGRPGGGARKPPPGLGGRVAKPQRENRR